MYQTLLFNTVFPITRSKYFRCAITNLLLYLDKTKLIIYLAVFRKILS